jgi:hypothetical protein
MIARSAVFDLDVPRAAVGPEQKPFVRWTMAD